MAWTCWAHQEPSATTAPAGREAFFDRGAQQGDTFGAAQSALALGEARLATTSRLATARQDQPLGVCDEWFIDDGQVLVSPLLADAWLRCLDGELESIGATRGHGNDAKSVERLLCPPGQQNQYIGWDTAYIRNTCKVKTALDGANVLGSIVSSDAQLANLARDVSAQAAATRDAIATTDHPAIEMVPMMQCTNVSKMAYLMRTSVLGLKELLEDPYQTCHGGRQILASSMATWACARPLPKFTQLLGKQTCLEAFCERNGLAYGGCWACIPPAHYAAFRSKNSSGFAKTFRPPARGCLPAAQNLCGAVSS